MYTKYKRFLKDDHLFSALKRGWYKTEEHRQPPPRLNGPPLLQRLDHINYIPGKLVKCYGKKRMAFESVGGGDDEDDDEDDDDDADDVDKERPAWYKKYSFFVGLLAIS